MNKIFSKTAFTLIELIVSLTLVSIIVLGIISIDMVLNNNGQDYGQRYLVRSQSQTTLDHILNDASMAAGSGVNVGAPASVPDTGILIGAAMGAASNNQFCIHQNQGVDIWVCYTFTPATNQIAYCNKTYNLADPAGFRGANGACLAAPTFLGSAYSITNLPAGSTLPQSPYFNTAGGQLNFSINIQNCLNNTAATCNNTGTSTDPVNNPEVQVSGTVSALQEGTG